MIVFYGIESRAGSEMDRSRLKATPSQRGFLKKLGKYIFSLTVGKYALEEELKKTPS
jgi:hypothetical protein